MRLFVLLATSTGNEKNTVGAPEFRDRAGAPGSPAHAKLLQMATGIAQALPAEHKPAVSAADLVDYICAVKVRLAVVRAVGRAVIRAVVSAVVRRWVVVGRSADYICAVNRRCGFVRLADLRGGTAAAVWVMGRVWLGGVCVWGGAG